MTLAESLLLPEGRHLDESIIFISNKSDIHTYTFVLFYYFFLLE